eukprot:5569106-Heterocapsa_arctica.AAC.1
MNIWSEQRSIEAHIMNENNDNDLDKICDPITFKDGARQRIVLRPQFMYIQARPGQANMNKARNSNEMLRQR